MTYQDVLVLAARLVPGLLKNGEKPGADHLRRAISMALRQAFRAMDDGTAARIAAGCVTEADDGRIILATDALADMTDRWKDRVGRAITERPS